MGRNAQRRRATKATAQNTRHEPPEAGLERRQVVVEPFACENVQVIEVLPEEDQSTDVAQVALQMFGRPAFLTRAGKVYLTYFTPESAVQVGKGLMESGETLLQRGPTATASGLVLSSSMAEAAAIARQREQTEALRDG